MRTLLALLACTAPALAQDPGLQAAPGAVVQGRVPPPSLERFSDWGDRDAEGRWVLFTTDYRQDATCIDAWITFLGRQKEHQVLEWIATTISFGTAAAFNHLAAADDPRWLRVAAWRLEYGDSHASGSAREKVTAESTLFLEWARLNPDDLNPAAKLIVESLQPESSALTRAADYLPPLSVDERLAALFRADEAVPFGDRLTAADDEVYVHQVIRSIDALATIRTRSPELSAGLLAATRHADERLALAACTAFLSLGAAWVPRDELLEMSDDLDLSVARREAAFLAASYANPGRVYAELHEHALEPAKPHWRVAIGRLTELGNRFTAVWLSGLDRSRLAPEDRELLAVLMQNVELRESAEDQTMAGHAELLLERAAYAELVGSPISGQLVEWTIARLRGALDKHGVRITLVAIRDEYEPGPEYAEEFFRASMENRVREYARHVLR